MTHGPSSAPPSSAPPSSAPPSPAPTAARRAKAPATLLAALIAAGALSLLAVRAPAVLEHAAPESAAPAAAPQAQDDEAPATDADPDPADVGAGDATDPLGEEDGEETTEALAAQADPDATADPDAPTPVPEQVAIAAAYPLAPLIPETELVFGPTLFGFDVAAVAAEQGGYLASHNELVGDEVLDGPAIVTRVARMYALGPRMLLALLELESGWVREQTPQSTQDPLGVGEPGLYGGLIQMAEFLSDQYYARRAGLGGGEIVLADGRSVLVPLDDPASLAVLAWLSRTVPAADWAALERPSRFALIWHELFGDPALFFGNLSVREAPEPPRLLLPFGFGQRWYAIAGPRPPRGSAAPAAEIAFAPPPAEAQGCFGSVEAVTAPIAGFVAWSESYGLLLDPDLDNDGWEGTGWSLVLRHLSPVQRVLDGRAVATGAELGFPFCEDGTGQTRVSLALRYDGAWVAAARPGAPLVLSDYQIGELGLGRPGFPARSYNADKVDGLNDVAALP